jgi:hypothetical protein
MRMLRRFPKVVWSYRYSLLCLAIVSSVIVSSQVVYAGPFTPYVWTNKGCGFDTALFTPGERFSITLYISGFGRSAIFRLWNQLSDGNWQLVKFAKMPVNRRAALKRLIVTADDAGLLYFEVWPSLTSYNAGAIPDVAQCTFGIVFFTETPPTPTVSTDKGCGTVAAYRAGEMMTISFGTESVEGRPHKRVYMQLLSENTSGQLQILRQTTVWVGDSLTLRRRVQDHDAGRLIVRLWESASKFKEGAYLDTAECAFAVTRPVGAAPVLEAQPIHLKNVSWALNLQETVASAQVELFDLKGQIQYLEPWGERDSVLAKLSSATIPNGVYLALVHLRHTDGRLEIKTFKLVVRR